MWHLSYQVTNTDCSPPTTWARPWRWRCSGRWAGRSSSSWASATASWPRSDPFRQRCPGTDAVKL